MSDSSNWWKPENLEKDELNTINEIISDYFEIDSAASAIFIKSAKEKLSNATGLFEFGQILNTQMHYEDKLDFICCIFEVAYADGELHYLEHHIIKSIANILHLHRDDLINAKEEIRQFLDI